MINFNDNIISASPGLKTDGITLSGNGTSAFPIGVIGNTLHRFEKVIYKSVDNATTGNFLEPVTAFDELLVELRWRNSNNSGTYGSIVQSVIVPKLAATQYCFLYPMGDETNVYLNMITMNLGSDFKSFSCPNISASLCSKSWTTTAWWTNNYSNSWKSQSIGNITGVKYL